MTTTHAALTGPTSRGPDHDVVVVGAGFGGIGVGIGLKKLGIEDFVLLEEAEDLGGTWRDNTYPGLEVDIPSYSFCYAFEPNPDWSQVFAPGAEVKRYADHCADKYGVRSHIRYRCRVKGIVWEPDRSLWRVQLEDGRELSARYVVSACGFLVRPIMPDIPGIDGFGGKLVHTARWDHGYDFRGKRVALIGTGATSIQVGPAIVDQLARLDVYQRTPIWLMPKLNPAISEGARRLFRRLPLAQKALRAATWLSFELFFATAWINHDRFEWLANAIERRLVESMRKQVRDPKVQEKLTPSYSFFCKRPSMSNTFYPMFNRDNVELVTDPIHHFTETGIQTQDGVLREVDAVICATGFRIFDRVSCPTFEVWGRNGKNLGDWWQERGFQAFQGTTIHDFPNYFMLIGPYSASGASYFDALAAQVAHISKCLKYARKRGANRIEVKPETVARDLAFVKRRGPHTVMFHGQCATSNSYYFDERGDAPGIRPSYPSEHFLKSRLFSVKRNYRIDRA